MLPLALLALLLPALAPAQAQSVPLSIPLLPPSLAPTVLDNFFGISIELSVINTLIGNTTSTIPHPILAYLSNIHAAQSNPLRIRIGGNSMDDSTYDPSQASPMLIQLDAEADPDDNPQSIGPLLFAVLSNITRTLASPSYPSGANASSLAITLGLSLRTPNDTTSFLPLAEAAESLLPPGTLDTLLLGNEPDLYYDHGDRPDLSNYTAYDYFEDFAGVIGDMKNGTSTNLLSGAILGGPTICCEWDLSTLVQEGYISDFSSNVKAITLQHYPQNNCFGSYEYPLSYYLSHGNVVSLSQWQSDGVAAARAAGKPVLMTEFNSASCGGISGISDTFGATLWALDYALQLASVGYSAAYVHTREAGVTYNVFDPPADTASQAGGWTTGVTYWPLVVMADALGGMGAVAVVDLGAANDAAAAYALYPNTSSTSLPKLLLINYGSSALSFSLPTNLSSSASPLNITAKYLLSADTSTELPPITWAGQPMSAAGDGTFAGAPAPISWTCGAGAACTVGFSGPGAAVVQFALATSTTSTTSGTTSTSAVSSTAVVSTISQSGTTLFVTNTVPLSLPVSASASATSGSALPSGSSVVKTSGAVGSGGARGAAVGFALCAAVLLAL